MLASLAEKHSAQCANISVPNIKFPTRKTKHNHRPLKAIVGVSNRKNNISDPKPKVSARQHGR